VSIPPELGNGMPVMCCAIIITHQENNGAENSLFYGSPNQHISEENT
jgi:hypothetical protein